MPAYAELVGHLSADRHLDEEIVSGLVADVAADDAASMGRHLSWVAQAFSPLREA